MANPNNKSKQIFIISILLILLVISLISNAILYSELNKYYRGLYSTILDPIGLSYFQGDNNSLQNETKTAIFLGDSRAAQWVSPEIEGFTFINRGIGNQTSAQVLLRYEEHVQTMQPDIVILQVCINDLKTIPLFPERKNKIITNCKVNLQGLVDKSLAINSKVILTTVFPTSGQVPLARQLVWSEDVYHAINEVNSFIRDFQNENVIIFDAAGVLANPSGNIKPEYVHDLLHLNTTGYEALNRELEKVIKNLK